MTRTNLSYLNTFLKSFLVAWMVIVVSVSYAQNYKPIEITDIRPVDILPIIWQIEAGDKYDYIEHLRIVEAMRIREMMWQYGAGNHSAEGYQKLMYRLNTGMTMETPKGYDNYEVIWWTYIDEPSIHAQDEWIILNTIVDHANFKVVSTEGSWRENMKEIVKQNPDNIYIFGNSCSAEVDKKVYNSWDNEAKKELCRSKNFLLFAAWWNINEVKWILRNNISWRCWWRRTWTVFYALICKLKGQ